MRHLDYIDLQLFLSTALLAALMGCLVYQYCARPSLHNNKVAMSSSYLFGYGIVIPFWLVFPYVAVYYLQIQNKIYRFMMTTCTPAIAIFRTTAGTYYDTK